MRKNESYLDDGLYASYHRGVITLRSTQDGDDVDHFIDLDAAVLDAFIKWTLTIERTGKVVRRAVNEIRRRQVVAGLPPCVPNYDTTFERDMDRQGPGRDVTDE